MGLIETPAQILSHAASPEAASSFISWRKKVKAPLTETAAARLLKTLNEIKAKGGDPDDALALAEERGWKAVRADWYFKDCPPPEKTAAPGDAQEKLQRWAESIASGKRFLCTNIPSTAAREMVRAGMVTPDQCKRVGLVL